MIQRQDLDRTMFDFVEETVGDIDNVPWLGSNPAFYGLEGHELYILG